MDVTTASIESRLEAVRGRISAAEVRAGRPPGSVTLVAVSKTFPTSTIRAAVEAGATDLGENRAQELRQKVAVLDAGIRWHFVGHLQTNKVRLVVGSVVLIHSVDRFGVAEAIARRARASGVVQPVLIEVNVSGEGAKHGVEPARALALASEVQALEGIDVRGLMTMAPYSDDPEHSRPYFRSLADIGGDLQAEHPGAGELSMGMTRDLEVGVEEGATIVRVGEAIFGARR